MKIFVMPYVIKVELILKSQNTGDVKYNSFNSIYKSIKYSSNIKHIDRHTLGDELFHMVSWSVLPMESKTSSVLISRIITKIKCTY